MSKFRGGVKEAAKMLAGLNPSERVKVLALISYKDPKMADALKLHMVTFEDLKFITVKMLVELTREIDLADLALALRIGSEELRDYILSNVSKSMREEINEVLLGKPQAVSKVEESMAKVMFVVRAKVDKGELIFSDPDDDEYV